MKKVEQSRLVQSESGQAFTEFAITITMTLLLIFGMIDFSRAIYTASIVQWAAQHGARTAIITNDFTVVEAAVKDRLVGLDKDEVVVTSPLSWSGNVVTVEVNYPFRFIAPIVAQLVGDTINMSSSASMLAH